MPTVPLVSRPALSRRHLAAASARVNAAVSEAELPLACPICYQPLVSRTGGGLRCLSCTRSFPKDASGAFVDLTVNAGAKLYSESGPTSQSLFQQPLISFVYEKGWRQSFSWAGFPGESEEFQTALSWFGSAPPDALLLDLSCGSGLFSRRFAASGRFRTIAMDFSENMLKEANGTAPNVPLYRADAARIPLLTGSVDCVHAGAALHCWPSPSSALAEISRILKPGGVFVASTFLDPASGYLGEAVGDANVLPLARMAQAQQSRFRWWNEAEIRELGQLVGMVGFERVRSRQFIIFKMTKPQRAAEDALM